MSRIVSAVKAAWAQLASSGTPQAHGKAAPSSEWIGSTIAYDRYASQAWGLRHQHEALVRMAVQWVGICSQFNAMNCAAVPLRLYAKRGADTGTIMDNRMGVKSRARQKYLRDYAKVGKSATYADKAGEFDEVKEHPALDLLSKPNPWWIGEEYRRLAFQCAETAGNFYDLKAFGDSGRMLLPMYPQWTNVEVGGDSLISGYFYGKVAADRKHFDIDDVIHHKPWPAMDNPYYGVSPLHNIITESNIFASALAYELSNMLNGMRPGDIAIEAGEGTTDAQVEQIRAELRRRYTGANQAGTPMIFVDAKPIPLARTNKDMEYMEGMKRIKDETLSAYGIPEALLQRGEGSISIGGGGEQAASMQVYKELTVLPRLRSYAETMTHELLPWFGIEPGDMWFAFDNPSGESSQFEINKAKDLIPISVMTINEARAEMDMPPVEWGDKPASQTQSASPFGGLPSWLTDNRADVADTNTGTVTDLRAKSIRVTDRLWVANAKHGKSIGEGQELPIPETMEEKLYRNLLRLFKGAKPELMGSLDPSYGLRVRLDMLPNMAELFAAATEPLSPIFIAGYDHGKTQVAGSVTMTPLNKPTIRAAETLRDYRTYLLRTVSDTVERKVRDTIASGLELGATLAERTDAVVNILGDGMRYAAENIARTESVNAYTAGSIGAWKDSGVVQEVQWLLSGDPCPFCKAMSGRTTPLGVPFFSLGDSMTVDGKTMVFDYKAIYGPSLHPGCRCGIKAILKGGA